MNKLNVKKPHKYAIRGWEREQARFGKREVKVAGGSVWRGAEWKGSRAPPQRGPSRVNRNGLWKKKVNSSAHGPK